MFQMQNLTPFLIMLAEATDPPVTPTPTALETMLGNVTSVLTSAVGWASSIGSTIVGTPILLLGVALPFVGFGVGLFKRMLNV